jgi:FkbM family methyltransferase
MNFRTVLSKAVSATPLTNYPVRVRKGFARGARWTAFPFSDYWRNGGSENDVAQAVNYLPTVKGAVFWDFGAHFGIHTIGLAMQAGPTGQAVAFEPDPAAFKKLNQHVAMNRLHNVKLYNAAVSASSGIGTLYLPHGHSAGSSVSHFQYDGQDVTGIPHITVKTVSADDLVCRAQIRLPSILKIDVQGHGAHAIAGAIKSISAARPIIAFSVHGEAEWQGVKELLGPLGYTPEALDRSAISWDSQIDCLLTP